MSASRRQALGEQGLRLVEETATKIRDIDKAAKAARRRRVEAASQRPAPGSSDLLGRTMAVSTSAGVDDNGKVRTMEVYDLVGMAPIHLKREG